MSKRAIVGILPAAGYATRLQPLNCSKEVLPVRGRPMMDYLVERMRAGGCTRLRVVTRPEKRDVVAHARALGAEVVLGNPATVSESLLEGLKGVAPQDTALIGFPDTLWEPVDGYRPLVEAVHEGCDAALGLFRIRASDLPRSDVVVVDASSRVLRVHVKPASPSSNQIWGCAAAPVETLAELGRTEWPGQYFDLLCREGKDVRGIALKGGWLDMGTRVAFAEASRARPAEASRSS